MNVCPIIFVTYCKKATTMQLGSCQKSVQLCQNYSFELEIECQDMGCGGFSQVESLVNIFSQLLLGRIHLRCQDLVKFINL